FVLPETESELAKLVDRLETSVSDWGRKNVPSNIAISVDFGWAMWSPDDSRTISELIQEADSHLYEQKRNR
ncbi:diguanylate cyclase, partial [Candidatus Bipolaricaulota bacterium]|nr:diguanylate cyclase [Candidatus Bipolaricaulota bacterium]MCK5586517.1 diguanylate cyclase [Candidatus Bipolaricaulota bacterium]